jgi:hypothetical protein
MRKSDLTIRFAVSSLVKSSQLLKALLSSSRKKILPCILLNLLLILSQSSRFNFQQASGRSSGVHFVSDSDYASLPL